MSDKTFFIVLNNASCFVLGNFISMCSSVHFYLNRMLFIIFNVLS